MDVCRFAASLGNRYALTQVTPRRFRDVYRDKCKMQVNVVPVKTISISVRQSQFCSVVWVAGDEYHRETFIVRSWVIGLMISASKSA
ncbi:hypothetical protein Xbud_03586 [Xenorhabdus budapestensis]|uniref:Uncharacterized protein n=1 Tax=Xenorhabdus budapestensis TaxID=290110 RepID=A0A2D0INL4_XENBU|nr:hypothetical protein Xbud_03586 [Xenorhabdus budapestensis]